LLFWTGALAGIAIAGYAWATDPAQRSLHNLWVFCARFISAGMWYLGSLWKLPWPVAHGFKDWLTNCVTYSSFQWHADLMQVFLTHIALVQPLVYLLEVFFALSLACGFAVRLSGTLAALFTLNLLIGLYNDPTEWVWTYVGIIAAHGMFASSHAGRSLGLDHLLRGARLPARRSRLGQLYAFVS
jgi:uncharacterized membrane protein YphA (DoxX/SURF4 family)